MPAHRRLLAAAACSLILVACSREEAAPPTTTSTTLPPAKVELSVVSVENNGTAAPTPELVQAIVATLDSYVDEAIITPLRTRRVGADLPAIFTASAAAQLAGEDRAALVHERLPRLPRIRAQRGDVALSTLAGPDGQIGVMVARLDLALRATGTDHDLDITHAGDFTLVPDAGTWKIDSYTMHTTRERHPEPTTTTTRAESDDEDED